MGGTYEFVKTASANLREKEDYWNVTLGGFFAGSILGLRGLFCSPLFSETIVIPSKHSLTDNQPGPSLLCWATASP